MAQILSSVSAEVLFKFRKSPSFLRCYGDGLRVSVGHRRSRINRRRYFSRRQRRRTELVEARAEDTFFKEDFADDYYEVLGLVKFIALPFRLFIISNRLFYLLISARH